jgi:hypothetical protein
VASFCAIASSASSGSPVVGLHSGRRRAGAAHATDVHPPATAAYATAAAAALPPLPLQPPPPTPAADAHAPGSTGLTVVLPDSSHTRRRVAPSINGKEEKSHINKYNPPPFPPSRVSLG